MELLGYFTASGMKLSVELLTGAALRITRVVAGSGETKLSDAVMTEEKQILAASPLRRSGNTVTLPVTLTAAQAEADYTLTEVGVYALDGEEEVLYRLYRLDEPVNILTGDRLTIRFELQETVSDASKVTVAGTAAGLLTEEDLALHLGVPDGIATLDGTGRVPVCQLPYTCGTEDLEAGVTELVTGALHFVYE